MSKMQNWIKHVYLLREEHEFGELEFYRNEEGRLHRDGAPAYISPTTIAYYQNGRRHGVTCDIWGSTTYYYEGVMVPSKYILSPESLTIKEILKNPNVEVRSVGLRVYGFERMLSEKLLKVIEVEKSTNYMLLKWEDKDSDESFYLVRVFNSTPEEDGTFDTFYLTVPPDMKTVRQAVAWTFYKEADEYNPVHET